MEKSCLPSALDTESIAPPPKKQATSTTVVRKAQNPLEEFFEVEQSAADDQARPPYGEFRRGQYRSPDLNYSTHFALPDYIKLAPLLLVYIA
jgi:hypothetical protein